MVSRKGSAKPVILTAGDMLCVDWDKGLEVGALWWLVGCCERMRDGMLVVWKMGREEGFIAFGRREARRVLRRDIASFKQEARSKEVKKADREMRIL
jgi:hypothetical protein